VDHVLERIVPLDEEGDGFRIECCGARFHLAWSGPLRAEGYAGPGFGDATNKFELDAGFIADYVNGGRGETIFMPEFGSSIVAQPAFDEGGNFIDVRFGPLSLNVDAPLAGAPSDYHLDAGLPSQAIGMADTKTDDPLLTDIDGDPRTPPAWDSGADETTP